MHGHRTPSWMRSIPYTRQHLPSERLTHMIQVDHVTQYHHHPDHPPEANLCRVFWRPTCLLLPINKQYKASNLCTIHQISPSVDTDTPTNHDTAQWTSTTTWISTIKLLECIIASWPLQVQAYISKSNVKIRTNDTFWQDAGQLSQGIDPHSPLQGIPASVLSEIGIMVSPEEMNPDIGLQPTGSNKLIISDGNAYSYGISGHYAGTMTLQRLRLGHARTQRELHHTSYKNVYRIQQYRRWNPYRTRSMHSWSTKASTDNKDKTVSSIQLENLVMMFNVPFRLWLSTTTEWITDPL